MIEKFSSFVNSKKKLEEKLTVDGIPVDNSLYSMVNAFVKSGKTDEVILSYFDRLSVDLSRVALAIEYCRENLEHSTGCSCCSCCDFRIKGAF